MTSAVLLAAGEVPPFVPAMAAIIVSAAIAGWISQRIGLVPIIGFLLAGVLIGPTRSGWSTRSRSTPAPTAPWSSCASGSEASGRGDMTS